MSANNESGNYWYLRYTVNLWYRYTYTLIGYRADVSLCNYRTGMKKEVLPPAFPCSAPLFRHTWLSSKNICLPAWCASGWSIRLAVGRLEFTPRWVRPKDLKSWYLQFPCLTFSIKGIVWKTSQQVRLLCPWARHLMGCPSSLAYLCAVAYLRYPAPQGKKYSCASHQQKLCSLKWKIGAKVWKKQTEHLLQLFYACLLGNIPHSALETNSTKL